MANFYLLTYLLTYCIALQSRLKRLKALRLVVSHHFLYKKLDEFGQDHDSFLKDQAFKPSLDRKVVVDNFDFTTKVHSMTEDHQNDDEHWVSVATVENRIHGDSLSTECPMKNEIIRMENSMMLPNINDHKKQRENYIDLCGKIACANIKCLEKFGDVAVHHIKHAYSAETRRAPDTVSSEFRLLIYSTE